MRVEPRPTADKKKSSEVSLTGGVSKGEGDSGDQRSFGGLNHTGL